MFAARAPYLVEVSVPDSLEPSAQECGHGILDAVIWFGVVKCSRQERTPISTTCFNPLSNDPSDVELRFWWHLSLLAVASAPVRHPGFGDAQSLKQIAFRAAQSVRRLRWSVRTEPHRSRS